MKIFLGFNLLVWLPYGLLCFFHPGFLAGAAGVAYTSPTGSTEMRAMYGGLQIAIGLLAGAALVRDELTRTALTALLFLTSGLLVTRVLGASIDGGFSGYTGGAIAFEAATATISFLLLREAT